MGRVAVIGVPPSVAIGNEGLRLGVTPPLRYKGEGGTPLRYSVVPFVVKGDVLGVAVNVRSFAVKGTPFAVGCGQTNETAEGFVVALRL